MRFTGQIEYAADAGRPVALASFRAPERKVPVYGFVVEAEDHEAAAEILWVALNHPDDPKSAQEGLQAGLAYDRVAGRPVGLFSTWGVRHTSMSVGDRVAFTDGVVMACAPFGWEKALSLRERAEKMGLRLPS